LTNPTISSLNKYNLDKGLVYLGYKVLIINIESTSKINLNRLSISFNFILDIKKLKNVSKQVGAFRITFLTKDFISFYIFKKIT
jgi:hypothetical protein